MSKKRTEFPFRHVEESLQKLTGDDGHNLRQWPEEFKMQNAKIHLMSGAANMFVDYACKARAYDELSTTLISELAKHQSLIERKKKSEESYCEYIYKMMKLAEPAELAVAALR